MFGGNWKITGYDYIIAAHILGLVGYGYYSLIFWLLSFVNITIGIK
jgi:hypothetical protein